MVHPATPALSCDEVSGRDPQEIGARLAQAAKRDLDDIGDAAERADSSVV